MKTIVLKTLKYIGLTMVGLIILITGYVYYLSLQRDTSTWIENTQVSENVKIPIEFMTSQKKYYGGHAFGWGGGDVKGHIKFMYKGIEYINSTSYIPVVTKFYEDSFYLIYYDRETHLRKTTFRFYKSTKNGIFEEIKAVDFPKHLAVQNRWFSSHESSYNKKEYLIGLNPQKMLSSMTVKIWYMIEGKLSLFNGNERIPIEFIEKYKAANFKNIKT